MPGCALGDTIATMDPDVRWMQRHKSFSAALNQLRAAVQLAAERPLSDLERQGLIQSFEFTHENVLCFEWRRGLERRNAAPALMRNNR